MSIVGDYPEHGKQWADPDAGGSYPDEGAAAIGDVEHTRQYGSVDPAMAARQSWTPPAPFNPFPTPIVRPDEPGHGAVIGFVKFSEEGKLYHYVAVQAVPGQWYLSGARRISGSAVAFTWAQLLDFVGDPWSWSSIGIVSAWDRLVPESAPRPHGSIDFEHPGMDSSR